MKLVVKFALCIFIIQRCSEGLHENSAGMSASYDEIRASLTNIYLVLSKKQHVIKKEDSRT